jgi:hypothetical protein
MTIQRSALVSALLAVLGAGLFAQEPARAPRHRQLAPGVETVVVPQILVQEQRVNPRIYALEFVYKPPRFITVDLPDGKGGLKPKRIWYLAYRVVNRTGAPRLFVPSLTLVTDTGRTYTDKVIPLAQKAITQREDATIDWKNSTELTAEMIPPTPEQGFDLSTYGIATWGDVDPETDFFTIYVTGLSNGYKLSEGDEGPQRTLSKTLELNFWRPGDERAENEKEIRPVSDAPESAIGEGQEIPPDHQWIYR